jgi:acyl carrier protein
LRDELIDLIKTWAIVPQSLDDQTSLIASGLLDSLALFNLIQWIEQKTGRRIDPTSVNVAAQWDSITSILEYIENSTKTATGIRQTRVPVRSSAQLEYRIVRYRPEHKQVVAEFQTGLWSPNPAVNRRYLEWKYEQNPYASEGRIYLAFCNGSLTGMRGFYASRWEKGVPSRTVPVLVADDLLVREDHRNRGQVTQMMQAAFEDLRDSTSQFVFNLSGSTLTVLNSLAMGWKSIGTLRPMRRKSPGFFQSLQHRLTEERSPFARLDRAAKAETRPRPEAMARLIQRIGHDGRLRHVRDQSYFDWRYRNPFREYRFLYSGEDELDGYLILKHAVECNELNQQVSIVDLEAINGEVQADLLNTAVTAGAFQDLTIWSSTADRLTLERLRALQFDLVQSASSAVGPTFLVRPIDLDVAEAEWTLDGLHLLEHCNWDIRMSYSMSG